MSFVLLALVIPPDPYELVLSVRSTLFFVCVCVCEKPLPSASLIIVLWLLSREGPACLNVPNLNAVLLRRVSYIPLAKQICLDFSQVRNN